MIKFYFLLIVCAITVALSPGSAGPDRATADHRYNDAQWKASHNSYAKPADMMTQLNDWHIRSIEFDIHVAKKKPLQKAERAPKGDFLVYHGAMDDYTNCNLLSECFAKVAKFHDIRPDHEVITIFFDMEGVGVPGHTKDDLYKLFENFLPEGSVFAPADLMAACPGAKDLQGAVTNEGCGWPLLSDLRGKIILVVSDGREVFVDGYDVSKEPLFLVNKNGNKENMRDDPDLVFFNMSGPNPFAQTVRDEGFVSRCYWVNKQKPYLKAKGNGCHHLATDNVDPQKYPWANTTDSSGRPFEVIGDGQP